MSKKRGAGDWRLIETDKEKYAAYLCSREWAEKREKVRDRAGNTCERCKVLPMDACHHLTYSRKYREDLEDLQAICNPCHEFTHGKSEFDPSENSIRRAIDWLGWQRDERFPDSWGILIDEFPKSLTEDAAMRLAFTIWLSNTDVFTATERLGLDDDDGDASIEMGTISPPPIEVTMPKDIQFWCTWLRRGCPALRFPMSTLCQCFELSRPLAAIRLEKS